jgi:hypothetical protein
MKSFIGFVKILSFNRVVGCLQVYEQLMHCPTILTFFVQYPPNVENLIGSRCITMEPTLMITSNFSDLWS